MLMTQMEYANRTVVTLQETEDGRFKIGELQTKIDRLLTDGKIKDKDRVLFRDATNQWHEAVHEYGRSVGIRQYNALTVEQMLQRLDDPPPQLTCWDDWY